MTVIAFANSKGEHLSRMDWRIENEIQMVCEWVDSVGQPHTRVLPLHALTA
jgi:hypothetical protein